MLFNDIYIVVLKLKRIVEKILSVKLTKNACNLFHFFAIVSRNKKYKTLASMPSLNRYFDID